MDVQLYVYDLSNGLARAFSPALLGIQIDAVWHTSIVLEGVEYVYDGGVKMVSPGKTHLGPPLNTIKLGRTDLPMDVILEYVESMKGIYTFEAYDIFTHNCNNFSNDLSTFLLGRGIPEHITNLPATVLNTPFGRAIKPEIQRMVQRSQEQTGGLVGLRDDRTAVQERAKISLVREAGSIAELDRLLEESKRSCAIVFFTSPTCRPCITLYPLFDDLSREAEHKAVLVKVDISRAYDIASKYSVRATPTFQTFLHGEKENRWSGSDPSQLRGNVEILLRMAWPPHPHTNLKLPVLRSTEMRPVLYSKVPPLAKLKVKMGSSLSEDGSVQGVLNFVSTRSTSGASDATLPNMSTFSHFIQAAPSKLPPETLFTVVDLLRVALVDPRFSGYFAEEKGHETIAPLIAHINDLDKCPYSLRIVTLQLACNLFSTQLYPEHILGCDTLSRPIIDLITTSLLDTEHANIRVAAASLAFNLAASNSMSRTNQQKDVLPSDLQIELAASLLEAINYEKDNAEAAKGYLLALALLLYCLPSASGSVEADDGGLVDLLESLEAVEALKEKKKLFPNEKLIDEVADVLLPSLRRQGGENRAVPTGW